MHLEQEMLLMDIGVNQQRRLGPLNSQNLGLGQY